MPDVLFVNASPLIFLGNADRLDLLQAIAGRIIVPQAVYDEVAGSPHVDAASRAVVNARWIEREQPKAIPNTVVEWDLGLGESAVIALALTALGSTAVIDDLSGRKCALSHGINVMGTLGVVIAAGRCGHIDDPRRVMFELRAAGMWLSESVIERALQIADGAR